MARINHKQRRGLSSVVGAVFMVLVMIGALNVILLTLRQQDTVTQAVIDKSNSSLNRLNEQISISDIRVTSNNKLNMTLTNSGGAAAKLASIYLVNETASPKEQYRYDLDNIVVDGRESVSGIGSGNNVPFYIDSGAKYTVKVVTTAGNSAVETISPLTSSPLQMASYVIPPTITSGQNVTLLFAVTNNNTDSTLATTVSPTISVGLTCIPYPSDTCRADEKISAVNDVLIPKGSTYLFKWVYHVKGPIGTVLTFTASLEDAKPGNSVTEKGRIQAVSSAQVAGTFLFARLIQQPEMEPVIPNPFGTTGSGNQALWGAVVANPTEGTMKVRKLVITLYSPGANSNDQILCRDTPTPVPNMPGSGSWTCPATNTAVWSIAGAALAIPPHSAKEFLVLMGNPTIGGTADRPSLTVNFNVFTDYGQFAKTGYDMALRGSSAAHPMVNVFLSNAVGDKTKENMKGVVSVQQGQQVTVHATIANFVPCVAPCSGNYKVDAGARLVIDIPQDFTNIQVTSSTGFDTPCSPTPFSDGSTQISCALTSALTGVSPNDARTIQFTITAPTVDQTKLYVLYLLADGTSENQAFTVGPVAETVIRVIE